MPETNPWQDLNQQLWRASLAAAAVVALSGIRAASAAFDVAGVATPDAAPFAAGSLGTVDLRTPVADLVAPVVAAQPALAGYAADPESGEFPGEEENDRAELLGLAAEMVARAGSGLDEDALREWADVCSTLVSDFCQHLDMLAYDDPDDAPDDIPGPLTGAVLRLQQELLTLLAAPDETTMAQVSRLVEEFREPLLAAVRDALEEE